MGGSPRAASFRALILAGLVASCSGVLPPSDGGAALGEVAGEAPSGELDGSDVASCLPAPARCCVSADCPSETPVCDDHGSCVGRQLGQPCTRSDGCAGGNCAEGVCCDGACATKCSSCRAANTGAPDGTCAPVLAGTACGPATCAARTSVELPAATCDGKGACVPAAAKSCETYTCSAATSTCRTTCGTSVDCASGYFCTDHVCAKRPLGQVCRGNDECASANCGGRCCPAGPLCLCEQPSPQNLLVNPGFDTGTDGWTIELPPAPDGGPSPDTVTWVGADDADGCPYSGSIELDYSQGDGPPPAPPAISQCFAIKAGTTYNFGARMAGDGYCFTATCELDFYTEDRCTGASMSGGITVSVSKGPWDPYWSSGTHSDAPPDARSARWRCTLHPPDRRTDCIGRFDAMYVSPDPFSY